MAVVLLNTAAGPRLALAGTPPAAPTGLAAAAVSAARIDGTYAPSATGAFLAHSVEYTPAGQPPVVVGVSGGAFSLTGLTGNVTYAIRVFVIHPFGSPSSGSVQVTTPLPGAPAAPTLQVNLVPGINSVAGLVWEPGDALEDTFRVERLDPGQAWQTLDVVNKGVFQYVDVGLDPGQTYQYQVHGVNASGVGNASAPVAVTTAAAYATSKPADPASLVVTAASATRASVSWANNATGNYAYRVYRRDPGALAYKCVKGTGTGTSFTDVGLTPGSTYTYRVMAVSTATTNPSNYAPAASVTLPARANGSPVEPSALLAERQSSSAVLVTWQDNAGGAAAFEVSYALWNAGLSNAFTVFSTTAAGATSATVTGLTAETPYRFRVRAVLAGNFSDYAVPRTTNPWDVAQRLMHGAEYAESTASPGTGSPRTITVGPGKQYATPDLVPTNALGPGDVVEIDPGTYPSLVLLSCSGTRANPITVRCTGGLAQLNAAGATASADYSGRSAIWGLGALHVGKRANMTFGYTVAHLVIQNVRTSNAYTGNTFTTTGGTQSWGNASAGIYLENGQDVQILGCEIDGNGNGVFGAGQGTFDRFLANVVIGSDAAGNSIHGNSGTGSPFSHQTYVEACGIAYVGNNYGPPRAGSVGIALKDRSVGVVVRNNKFSGGQHCVQLSEAQNQWELSNALDARLAADLWGNELYVEPGNPNSPVWAGGDQGNTQLQAPCVYRCYHNTAVVRNDQTGSPSVFKIPAVKVSSPMGILDERNSVNDVFPNTPGHTPSDFGLVDSALAGADGGNVTASLGATWAPPGYKTTTGNNGTFTGVLSGSAHILVGGSADPGFVDQAGGDYHLLANSACVGAGTRLPLGASVDRQYHAQNTLARPASGAGADLGAYHHGVS